MPDESKTELSFQKYLKELKPEIREARTTMHKARKDYHGAINSRLFKRCLFRKSEAALAEYEGLLNGVVTVALQHAINIKESVIGIPDAEGAENGTLGYMTQADNVKVALDQVLEALRKAKSALWDVETSSNTLAEKVENSDQSQEKKWLKTNVKGFEKYIKDFAGDPRQSKQGLADQTNDLADDALEVAVKVAGINASINVTSLEKLCIKLEEDCNALNIDITDATDGNIKFAQSEKTEAQKNLTDQNIAQSTTRAAMARTRLVFAGLKDTQAFVKETGCKEGDELAQSTRTELEEIARKIEKSFH